MVGVGKLGEAVINYQGFKDEGYLIKVAFDIAIPKSKNINNIEVKSISDMNQHIKAMDIKIGIVTVPSPDAQGVIDRLVQCGIKGILNYAPMKPIIPKNVSCMNIDSVLSLQSMSYYLDK